jgi:transposase
MSLTGNTPCEGGQDRCLGRSRGGLTTKIHALVDKKGRPIKLKLTAGQASDVASAAELIADLPEDVMLIADKGYDANALRQAVAERGAWANIPPKANRKDPICFSKYLYKARNLIERFFNKIKHFRRIATRYDKLAENFLAALKLAAIRIWLR